MDGSESVHILYMEDDLGQARLVRKRMKRAGYTVDVVRDGIKGLEMFRAGQYDVVAVDQKMPGYNGLEIIERLASLGPLPPIVMITGHGNETVAVEAMKMGAGDYVVKDVEGKYLETLPRVIERLLERHRLMEEKKQAEEALRIEHGKLKGVLDALGEGMYIVDKAFTIEYQNEILETLFPGGSGAKCHALYTGSATPCETCRLGESVASGKIRRIEAVFVDGRDYDMTFSPFTDMDGEVKAIVLARDISEKKNFQAKAARAGQLAALGELAAGVAHEINNPMNGIISYAEVLKDECEDKGEDDEIPVRIIKEGERVAGIVRNLLSFAREHSADPSPIHPRDILFDALGLVESRLKLDGVQLTVDIPTALPAINARGHEIQQVFLNLISNAHHALCRKFPARGEDKTLEIKSETVMIQGRQYVRTTFRDDGPGIPGKILDKITNPFFSTKPPGQGTGLGLSISHGVIEAHGGKLRFESKEGEYTKAIVDLPLEKK
ncbi:MAG: response regulator [Desulfobacterales bacterium]|nr:response regulator [Desulfobacterales bacterium]